MQKLLLILNDSCYGIERSYNALRLATALANREDTEVRIHLTGDAVTCAKKGQAPPTGFYNVERMLQNLAQHEVFLGA